MIEGQNLSFKHFEANKLKSGESNAVGGIKAKATSKVLSPHAIEDLLFKEIRELEPITITRIDLATGEEYQDNSTNKYDFEADTYTNRMVFGDFSDPNIPKPVFRLDIRDFSAELKDNLAERVRCGGWSIHRVVQNAIYRLIRARFLV
jgi:hypothetical protein